MEYNFKETEKKWQLYWQQNHTYKTDNPEKGKTNKPKYYVLDMFPYPSGAGLHVGHPLGYIASDIVARYKRHCGFNVLHPMGYDSFGLPAEQYAIETGQDPAVTTEKNINRYREQLEKIGFSYDWSREIRTSNPDYYKWTQWIFLQLFDSWYSPIVNKAEPIATLIHIFETSGFECTSNVLTGDIETTLESFTAHQWKSFADEKKQAVLMHFRLAYLSETYVNWCPALGTVLANDEVKDGVSERGGHAVERKLMWQWSLRITAYSERLLQDLHTIDWSDSLKEAQRNWIGKSSGCSLFFELENSAEKIEVFTTRIDTVFGVSFITLAPEHELVPMITTAACKEEVETYIDFAKNRTERERMAEVKKVTGAFTGAYVLHPFTKEKIPVWIGDYVLSGYGTGAVMAVPAHDSRDFAFATQFNLPIKMVIDGGEKMVMKDGTLTEAYEDKQGVCINSDFMNGLHVLEAIEKGINKVEASNIGKQKINYRLRDAIFGRQRYWGEPIPVYYKDNTPYTLTINNLPLILPQVDKYLPTETGEPPLARAANWNYKNDEGTFAYETTTMPGWAGSSWYYLRYMDPHNKTAFVDKDIADYWQQVDLYFGGSEHATGHLLYVRFWTKFLFDMGYINFQEPAKKLINQGMIQGTSAIVYRIVGTNKFVSFNLRDQYETTALRVDVNMVENSVLDIELFKKWRDDFAAAEFILEKDKTPAPDGIYLCGHEVEKMSKRWNNVVNPDDVCDKFGADCLRMYEMFLGPLEQSKPWNTNGITGVSGFLRKLWRLYNTQQLVEIAPSPAELKILHRAIKKITEDIERFSFNTSVSTFMITVNELTDIKCNNRHVLTTLAILISPYAPHIAEELWERTGNTPTVTKAAWPVCDEQYLVENSFEYPVSINGKVKFKLNMPLNWNQQEVEQEVLSHEKMKELLQGGAPKKFILVQGRIVNVVI
ncbi:MAG: leucine--tRNA ligase [Bacteroidetes bacterium]|nr:leucine--tRNA ligase [Bacteroidota bacterium]